MIKFLRSALAMLLLVAAPAAAKEPVVGQPAPDFQVTLMDGSKISLADLRGQVVVLNFWATWCGPCKKELPLLDGYYQAQKAHGLRVFAVTTEDSLPLFQMRKLFAVMHITPSRKISGPYWPKDGLPTNFVIDRAGKLRYAKADAFDLNALNTLLVPLLNEPAPTS